MKGEGKQKKYRENFENQIFTEQHGLRKSPHLGLRNL